MGHLPAGLLLHPSLQPIIYSWRLPNQLQPTALDSVILVIPAPYSLTTLLYLSVSAVQLSLRIQTHQYLSSLAFLHTRLGRSAARGPTRWLTNDLRPRRLCVLSFPMDRPQLTPILLSHLRLSQTCLLPGHLPRAYHNLDSLHYQIHHSIEVLQNNRPCSFSPKLVQNSIEIQTAQVRYYSSSKLDI